MKDLYFKMSLESDASDDEIATLLQQRPELNEYSAILLNRDRRTFYDRTHATLRTIGELRHRLKLETGDSWFLQNFPDFAHRFNPALAPAPAKATAADAAPENAGPQPSPQAAARSEKPALHNRRFLILAGVIGLILLILAISYL